MLKGERTFFFIWKCRKKALTTIVAIILTIHYGVIALVSVKPAFSVLALVLNLHYSGLDILIHSENRSVIFGLTFLCQLQWQPLRTVSLQFRLGNKPLLLHKQPSFAVGGTLFIGLSKVLNLEACQEVVTIMKTNILKPRLS